LKFYYVIINLYDHKLAKSRNFGSPTRKKFKKGLIFFYKNSSFTARMRQNYRT